jgi:uncharacterized membrane protein
MCDLGTYSPLASRGRDGEIAGAMMDFASAVTMAAKLMEAAGVGSMVLGAVVSAVSAAASARHRGAATAFRLFRQYLGQAILLGLEFLVAADIIRTVSEAPTLENVAVLAVVVLIRTFLSFTLEVELDRRWPWQARRAEPL